MGTICTGGLMSTLLFLRAEKIK